MLVLMCDTWTLTEASGKVLKLTDLSGNTMIANHCKLVDKSSNVVYFLDKGNISVSHASVKLHGEEFCNNMLNKLLANAKK